MTPMLAPLLRPRCAHADLVDATAVRCSRPLLLLHIQLLNGLVGRWWIQPAPRPGVADACYLAHSMVAE